MYFSYSKSISKAIGLKPSRTRDYLKQLVDEGILEVDGEYKNGADAVQEHDGLA